MAPRTVPNLLSTTCPCRTELLFTPSNPARETCSADTKIVESHSCKSDANVR